MGNHNSSSSSSYQPVQSTVVLYQDRYCKIFEDRIEIFDFYFPVVGTKTVKMSEIKSVQTGSQLGLEWHQMKAWGIGLSDIAWAVDMSAFPLRDADKAVVITVGHDMLRKGFSSDNVNTVKRIINQQMFRNRNN